MSHDNGFEEWGGYMEAKITKLEEQFSSAKNVMRESNLFEGISIYVNGLTDPSSDDLKRIMMVHGGIFHHYERSHTTYIIASNLPDVKVRNMNTSNIIKPQWIVDCVREKRILDYTKYLLYTEQKTSQPRLTFKRKEPSNAKGDTKTHTDRQHKKPTIMDDIKMEDNLKPAGTNSDETGAKIADVSTTENTKIPPPNTGAKPKVKTESKTDTRDSKQPVEDHNSKISESKASTKSPENISSSLNFLNTMLRAPTSTGNLLADMVVQSSSSSSAQTREETSKSTVKSSTAAKTVSAATASASFIEEYFRNSRLHYISTLGEEFKQYIFDLRERHGDGDYPARKTLKELLIRERNPESDENFGPLIMHIDMDCFFVSVGLRKYPSLRGKPVVVTHSKGTDAVRIRPGTDRKQECELLLNNPNVRLPSDKNPADVLKAFQTESSMSEIASCSYEARARGIRNGMFVGLARTMCPELMTIPYDFDAYRAVAYALYDTVAQYTLDVEAVSLDEMYVNLENVLAELKVPPMYFVSALREEVFRKTGCTCSAGVGANRLQARIATKRAKPNGQFHMLPSDVIPIISEMSVNELPGVGRSTACVLKEVGIVTCEHLRNTPVGKLQVLVGKAVGLRLHENAQGIDSRTLEYQRERRSISAEVNYGIRLSTMEQVENFLIALLEVAHKRLTNAKRKSRCVIFKVMIRAEGAPEEAAKYQGHGICDCISKTINIRDYTDDLALIQRHLIATNKQLFIPPKDYRGMGIIFTRLNETKSKPNKQGIVLKEMFKRIQERQEAKQTVVEKKDYFVVPSKRPPRAKNVSDDEGTEESSGTEGSSDSETSSSDSEDEEARTGVRGDDDNEFGGAAQEGNTPGTQRRSKQAAKDRKKENEERRRAAEEHQRQGGGGDDGGGGGHKNGGSGGGHKNGGNGGGDKNGNGDKKKDKKKDDKKDDKKDKKKNKDKKKKDEKDKKDEREEIELQEADVAGTSKKSTDKKDEQGQQQTADAEHPSTSTKKPTGLKKFFSFSKKEEQARKEIVTKKKRKDSHSSQEPSWSTVVDYMTYTGRTSTNECNTGFSMSTDMSSIPEDSSIKKDPTSSDSDNKVEEALMDWQDKPESSTTEQEYSYMKDITQIVDDAARTEEGHLSTVESETLTEGEDAPLEEGSPARERDDSPLDDTTKEDEHALIDDDDDDDGTERDEKSELTENMAEEDECALLDDDINDEEASIREVRACRSTDDDDEEMTESRKVENIADTQMEDTATLRDADAVCSDEFTIDEESECTERIPLLAANPIEAEDDDDESASSSDKRNLLSKHSDEEDTSITDTADVSVIPLPNGVDPNIMAELPRHIQFELLQHYMLNEPKGDFCSSQVRFNRIETTIARLPVVRQLPAQVPATDASATSGQAALESGEQTYQRLESEAATPIEPGHKEFETTTATTTTTTTATEATTTATEAAATTTSTTTTVEVHIDPDDIPGTSKSFQQPRCVTMPRVKYPPSSSESDLLFVGLDGEFMGTLEREMREAVQTHLEIEHLRARGEQLLMEAEERQKEIEREKKEKDEKDKEEENKKEEDEKEKEEEKKKKKETDKETEKGKEKEKVKETEKVKEKEKEKIKGVKKKHFFSFPRVVSRAAPSMFSLLPQSTLRTASIPLQIAPAVPTATTTAAETATKAAEVTQDTPVAQALACETGYLPLIVPRESAVSLREGLQFDREVDESNFFINGNFRSELQTLIRENPQPSDELVRRLCRQAAQLVYINAVEYLVAPLEYFRRYAAKNAPCSWHSVYQKIVHTVNDLCEEVLQGKSLKIGFQINCDKC